MKEEEPLYVGILDPVDLRKDLLNSSKVLITSLRKYETFNTIREGKEAKFAELRKIIREIEILNRRLKQILPKTHLKPKMKEEEPAEPLMPIRKIVERPVMPRIIKEKTRLAELEDELAKVEEKLGTIE